MAALNYLGVVLVLLVIIGVGVASGVCAAVPQPASSSAGSTSAADFIIRIEWFSS